MELKFQSFTLQNLLKMEQFSELTHQDQCCQNETKNPKKCNFKTPGDYNKFYDSGSSPLYTKVDVHQKYIKTSKRLHYTQRT